ncbi:MAG: Rrf2 family transcriptional regulator [Bacteroidales bacterium]|nr:Rrf2 family transcriptional regulator [Bacteroidales bacterium]MDD3988828.1 Rrf2 family transcriptional regulator [Bacteroidales bacterium]
MKINTKVRYGMRAMIFIAQSEKSEGVLQREIADNQNISVKYLDSIIASLKAKGLIANVRGKGNGYRLTRPPEEITALDIYNAFEPVSLCDCIDNAFFCDRSANCCTRHFWAELNTHMTSFLAGKNLAQIMNKQKG